MKLKLICPNGHRVGWRKKKCPKCGQHMTARAVSRRLFTRLKHWPLVKCPQHFCGKSFPLLWYDECPFCTTENTLGNAALSILEPIAEQVRRSMNVITRETRRKFQRVYLLASLMALVWAFHRVAFLGDAWWGCALVSVVYLAAIGVLIKWFVPRAIVITFLLRTTWVVKLALVLNYFASLTLLQLAIHDWWEHFAAVAGVVGATWAGAWVFCRLFFPMSNEVKNLLLGDLNKQSRSFDPMGDQGRRGFWEEF